MRKIHINSVKPGDKFARPILQENGNILLGAGVELNAAVYYSIDEARHRYAVHRRPADRGSGAD